MRRLVSALDPARIVALHRHLQLRFETEAGKGVRVTHRAQIYNHSRDADRIRLGEHVILDGTLEVYEEGQLTVGSHTFIGRSRIYAARSVDIGRWVYISDNCAVMDSDLHPAKASLRRAIAEAGAEGCFPDVYTDVKSAPVSLGDHAWLGFGCIVLKGVHIGEGAIVAAGSVVTRDVPPWTVVAGRPAAVVRELREEERF
jgi:acetyltransferase-like isoleucine patch superfamily enzyme